MGQGPEAETVDGDHLTAKFNHPVGLAFSADFASLFVVDWGTAEGVVDGALRKVNREARTVETLTTGLYNPDHVAVHPVSGNPWTLTGYAEGKTLKEFSPATGALLDSWLVGAGHGLGFSPDGQYVYTVGPEWAGSSHIRKWRVDDHSLVWHTQYALSGPGGGLFTDACACAVSPDGSVVYAAHTDFGSAVHWFDADTGTETKSVGTVQGTISIDTRGDQLLIAGPGGTNYLQVWDAASGALVMDLTRRTMGGVCGVSVFGEKPGVWYFCDCGLRANPFSPATEYIDVREAPTLIDYPPNINTIGRITGVPPLRGWQRGDDLVGSARGGQIDTRQRSVRGHEGGNTYW